MSHMDIENQLIIELFKPLVDYIADIVGDECEVVLHDLTSLDASIVAIKNGHLSGRTIGSPATDLVLKILTEHKDETDLNYISNYLAVSDSGRRFRSASYFIKNNKKKIIGVLCVNIDLNVFDNFSKFLDKFTNTYAGEKGEPVKDLENVMPIENLQNSVSTIIENSVKSRIDKMGEEPSRMTVEERQYLIKYLFEDGIFSFKGAVSEVSKILEISEPTVYRYLKSIK